MPKIDVSSLPTKPLHIDPQPASVGVEKSFAYGIQGLVGDFDLLHTIWTNPPDNTVIAKNNPRRVCLMFTAPSGGTIRVGPNPFLLSGADGFTFSTNQSIIEFVWSKHAILTTVPWFCFGASLGGIVVYEIIWSPQKV